MGNAESVSFETSVDVLAAFALSVATFVPLYSGDWTNAGNWFKAIVGIMREGGGGAFNLDPGWFYWMRLVPYASLAAGSILYWTRNGSARSDLFVAVFVLYGVVIILDKVWYHVIYSYLGGSGWGFVLLVLALLGTIAVDVILWIEVGNRTGEDDLWIFVASGILVIIYGLWLVYLLIWNYFFWVASSSYKTTIVTLSTGSGGSYYNNNMNWSNGSGIYWSNPHQATSLWK